nr:MAG TPA: hypothetical protein [Caudoviricetes sp.]
MMLCQTYSNYQLQTHKLKNLKTYSPPKSII